MTALTKYVGLDLEFVYNASVGLDMDLLRNIASPLVGVPYMLSRNCCWANVCMALARIFGRKFSEKSTMNILAMIIKMDSVIASPMDISDDITELNLPVTVIEYCSKKKLGHSIGKPNGPIVALVNVNDHYQIWLQRNSTIRGLFSVLVINEKKFITKTRRRRKTKYIAVAFDKHLPQKTCWSNNNPYSL